MVKPSLPSTLTAPVLPPSKSADASRPPVMGARLGKDQDGNPAWFVPNPDAPGKFMRVNA